MKPPRYLIAEDEPLLARALAAHLTEHWNEAECAGFATNGDETLGMVEDLEPEVIFLDVRMPVRDGLQTAQALCERAAPPLIVFVTAYDEYALAAFDAAAVDYLLKPVDTERLVRCITRLRERTHGRAFPAHEIEHHPLLMAYLRKSAFLQFLWGLGFRAGGPA